MQIYKDMPSATGIENTNTGFLPIGPSDNDWKSSDISGINFELRNPSGDWTAYAPQGENQKFRNFDTMACVTYSALDSIETQLRLLTGQNFNFSDRFIAKLSGTTQNGNSLQEVADTIRKYGLVPEEVWPASDDFVWADYYKDIPAEILAKGKLFLNEWNITYEWVTDLGKELQHAPIQIATAVCPGWNNPPVKSCGLPVQHATCLLKTNSLTILDHYQPYIKTLAADYPIPYKFKVLVSRKMVETRIYQAGKELGLLYRASDEQEFINILRQNNKPFTLKPDGSLDWSSIKPEVIIKYIK